MVSENRGQTPASEVSQGPKMDSKFSPLATKFDLTLPPGPQKGPGIPPLLKTDLEVAKLYPKITKK